MTGDMAGPIIRTYVHKDSGLKTRRAVALPRIGQTDKGKFENKPRKIRDAGEPLMGTEEEKCKVKSQEPHHERDKEIKVLTVQVNQYKFWLSPQTILSHVQHPP